MWFQVLNNYALVIIGLFILSFQILNNDALVILGLFIMSFQVLDNVALVIPGLFIVSLQVPNNDALALPGLFIVLFQVLSVGDGVDGPSFGFPHSFPLFDVFVSTFVVVVVFVFAPEVAFCPLSRSFVLSINGGLIPLPPDVADFKSRFGSPPT